MQGKWLNAENFASEERKQSKNHCSPVKLESKKNDKKIIDPGRDRVPIERRRRATSHLVLGKLTALSLMMFINWLQVKQCLVSTYIVKNYNSYKKKTKNMHI